jgi:hypothetical protein
MREFNGAQWTVLIVCLWAGVSRCDDTATAILDKAIKAAGGEEKLGKAEAFSWKAKGRVIGNGNESEFESQVTIKGIDYLRREFGNDRIKLLVVVNGDRGWRRFRDQNEEIVGEGLSNEKRTIYLQVAAIRLVPLKGKGFKCESVADENVGDKPAAVLKVTGPDGKEFTLCFDKDSGLPIKQVVKMPDAQGTIYLVEVTFAGYKDFDGIKKATKTEVRRDGKLVQQMEMTEFKVLDKVDPQTFAEPN